MLLEVKLRGAYLAVNLDRVFSDWNILFTKTKKGSLEVRHHNCLFMESTSTSKSYLAIMFKYIANLLTSPRNESLKRRQQENKPPI